MLKEDIPFKNYDHAAKLEKGFHFTIDRDGHWYCHDPAMGTGPIKNDRISKLFAGAGSGKYAGKGLSRDADGKYWLKAPPNDVYGIDVEDVPFIINACQINDRETVLTTNFGEDVILGENKTFIPGRDAPYVEIRDGLMARLGRNVFYELAAVSTQKDGQFGFVSGGMRHELGRAE